MKNMMWIATIAGLSSLALPAQDPRTDTAESKPAAKKTVGVGDKVEGATKFRDLDGVEKSFADLKGKLVVVVFDSIKCPTNKWVEPRLMAQYAAWEKAGDVALVVLNANRGEIGPDPYKDGKKPEETYAALRAHLKKHDVKYALYADHGNKLADMFAAQKTPHCFVLDKELVVRYAGAYDDDARGDKTENIVNYVDDAVAALRKGEKPKTETMKAYG